MIQSSDSVNLTSFYSSAFICTLKTQAALITSARQLEMNEFLQWKTFSKPSMNHNRRVYEKKNPRNLST